MAGNVFLKGARPCKFETPRSSDRVSIRRSNSANSRTAGTSNSRSTVRGAEQAHKLVDRLGCWARQRIPDLPYENADGSPIRIDTDYFGKKRDEANPFPGPFELPRGGKQTLRIWPI